MTTKHRGSSEIFDILIKIVVSNPMFRHREAYKCPYCNYTGRSQASLNARELVTHLMAVHKEEIVELLFNLK